MFGEPWNAAFTALKSALALAPVLSLFNPLFHPTSWLIHLLLLLVLFCSNDTPLASTQWCITVSGWVQLKLTTLQLKGSFLDACSLWLGNAPTWSARPYPHHWSTSTDISSVSSQDLMMASKMVGWALLVWCDLCSCSGYIAYSFWCFIICSWFRSLLCLYGCWG